MINCKNLSVPFIGILSSQKAVLCLFCSTGPLLLLLLRLLHQGNRHHSLAILKYTKLKRAERWYCFHCPCPCTESQVKMHISFTNVPALYMFFQRDAVATSHCSQPNNLEFDMAMEWCLHQARHEQASESVSKVLDFIDNYCHYFDCNREFLFEKMRKKYLLFQKEKKPKSFKRLYILAMGP